MTNPNRAMKSLSAACSKPTRRLGEKEPIPVCHARAHRAIFSDAGTPQVEMIQPIRRR
jgi:hypothetical protein